MAILTAPEAVEQLSAAEQVDYYKRVNGSRRLPATLGRIKRMQQEETFSICNVGPWDHRVERQSLMLTIPGFDPANPEHKKLGCACSERMPDIRREAKIVDENEFTFFEDDGRQVARDLIGVGHSLPMSSALVQYGVFVPVGSEPTKEEIARARKELDACIERLINDARIAYDKGPEERSKVVNERHLWAGRQRGVKEAWMHSQHTQQSVQCEMCGEYNPAGIAKCKCGNIIDFELFKRLDAKQKAQLAELDDPKRK